MDTVLPSPAQPSAGDGKTVLKAHIWARDPNDWYVETPGCNSGLFATEKFLDDAGKPLLIVDPFCGMGRILDAAAAAGHPTLGLDVIQRERIETRHPFALHDFDNNCAGIFRRIDEITNRPAPPFALVCNPAYIDVTKAFPKGGAAIDRVQRLVQLGAVKTAILMRSKWANGKRVSRALEAMCLRHNGAISPRPSMPPGAVILAAAQKLRDEDGDLITVGGGKEDYSWFIFERGYVGRPTFGWVRQPEPAKRITRGLQPSELAERMGFK